MPPALVVILLVSLGAPAVLRALTGRPRTLVAGYVAAATAALLAQVGGEIAGWRTGVLGDAQLLVGGIAALLGALAVAALEPRAD
ncbi:MAG: hypothetical protein Q7S25_01755 [Candidatus Limnocylindria bacterium]|nr:hypothetical protein [Candidatus Limnocylindria bacterium]